MFYSPETFYQRSEKVIRYQYNTDTVSATVSTLGLRTAIKVFGKSIQLRKRKIIILLEQLTLNIQMVL